MHTNIDLMGPMAASSAPPEGDPGEVADAHPYARHVNPHLADLLAKLRLDKRFIRGEGCDLFDDAGRRYLDCIAAYGALPFGYNPPAIWRALEGSAGPGRAQLRAALAARRRGRARGPAGGARPRRALPGDVRQQRCRGRRGGDQALPGGDGAPWHPLDARQLPRQDARGPLRHRQPGLSTRLRRPGGGLRPGAVTATSMRCVVSWPSGRGITRPSSSSRSRARAASWSRPPATSPAVRAALPRGGCPARPRRDPDRPRPHRRPVRLRGRGRGARRDGAGQGARWRPDPHRCRALHRRGLHDHLRR